MIYLINIPSSVGYKYWVVSDTTGACLSAPTPQDALAAFKRASFKLTKNGNDYSITAQYVLAHGEYYGDIIAKAPTIRQLVNTYPEYFI